ncbi:galactose mutarotase-like domain-containing protein [Mycena olivaceomarginata]|nr:galactose mutarotase-like domain-containing protein [Mycena olivaceomarginata]
MAASAATRIGLRTDTLHSGVGWDLRNWTVVDLSATSVKYLRIDDAENGFPGTVNVTVTYSVENRGVLSMSIHATASEKTPIMVTHHDYLRLRRCPWTQNADLASRRIEVDGDAIPTGNLLDVSGTPYDFRAGRALGAAFEEDRRDLPADFPGYDNALIYDKSGTGEKKSGVSMLCARHSPVMCPGYSSIYGQTSPPCRCTSPPSTSRSEVHGGPEKTYGERSTVAIEQEGWIDAINTPEWNQNQICESLPTSKKRSGILNAQVQEKKKHTTQTTTVTFDHVASATEDGRQVLSGLCEKPVVSDLSLGSRKRTYQPKGASQFSDNSPPEAAIQPMSPKTRG